MICWFILKEKTADYKLFILEQVSIMIIKVWTCRTWSWDLLQQMLHRGCD